MIKKMAFLAAALPALAFAETPAPDAAAPAPAAPAASTEPAPVAVPAAAPIAAPAAEPKPVTQKSPVIQSVGDGGLGALIQGWFTGSTDTRFSSGSTTSKFATSGENNAGTSTFRLRRAEMSYDGKLGDVAKYRVMIDPSRLNAMNATSVTSSKPAADGTVTVSVPSVKDILQDAYVGLLAPLHEVRVGQFTTPLTMEGFAISSGKLDFAERAIVTRTFGTQRDMGVMLLSSGVPFVEYEVAVVNGTGQNVFDNAPMKDGAARFVVKPLQGVSFGGSAQVGQVWNSTVSAADQHNRAGVEAAVELAGVSLKGEYMGARDGQYDSGSKLRYTTAAAGWYTSLGYRFGPVQAVARFEKWDSDARTSVDACKVTGASAVKGADKRCVKDTIFAAGVNYDLAPSVLHGAKLQLDWYRDLDEVKGVTANEIFVATQVKF